MFIKKIYSQISLCELRIRNVNIEILNYLNTEINKTKCNYIPSHLLLYFVSCETNLEMFNTVAKKEIYL